MPVTCAAARLAARLHKPRQHRLYFSPTATRWPNLAARLQWRQAAGRGGGAGCDSDSEEEDFFNSRGSMSEEYYDSDDVGLDGDAEMRLFLDSADVKQWEAWAEAGLFYGE